MRDPHASSFPAARRPRPNMHAQRDARTRSTSYYPLSTVLTPTRAPSRRDAGVLNMLVAFFSLGLPQQTESGTDVRSFEEMKAASHVRRCLGRASGGGLDRPSTTTNDRQRSRWATPRSATHMRPASRACSVLEQEAGQTARKTGQPSDVDVVSLREMVAPCAKQCCANKKEFCVAAHPDDADLCDGQHESCLLHAANGRNCAWSPLCSKQEKDEATADFKDKLEKDKAPNTEAAQAAAQLATPPPKPPLAAGALLGNLRSLVEPCAKECCTNKKDFCLTGEYPASAWTTCKSSADGSNARDECCKDRMDSCIYHAANGRNCALSPLCH